MTIVEFNHKSKMARRSDHKLADSLILKCLVLQPLVIKK